MPHFCFADIELSGSKWSKWGPGVGGGAMNNAIQVQVMNNYNMDVGTQTGDSRRCSIDDDDDIEVLHGKPADISI